MSVITKFEIKLEPRHHYYRPNDKINGKLIIKQNRQLFLNNIRLVLVGVVQIFDNRYVIYGDTKKVAKNEQTILFHRFDLVDSVGAQYVGYGEHHLPFQYKLSNEILSSFNGVFGRIQYYVEADMMSDVILKNVVQPRVYLHVIGSSNFSVDQMRLSVGGKTDKTLRFLMFKRGAVRFSVHLDRKGYFIGDQILVNFLVANRSSVRVIPRATLYQLEKYFPSDSLYRNHKIRVCHSIGKDIEPSTVSSRVIVLKIPFNLNICSIQTSLIRVNFKIHVTIDIPNSFDLHIDLPLLISNYVL